ncbi:MAG: hypothetical protein ACOYK6_07935 [Chthoniobacterales bacterium]
MKKKFLSSLATAFLLLAALLIPSMLLAEDAAVPKNDTDLSLVTDVTDDLSISFTDTQLSELGNRLRSIYSPEKKMAAWDQRGFAYIGIAQFLWYPAGTSNTFGDDWPNTASVLKDHGVDLEGWMMGPCPWPSEKEFSDAQKQNDPRLEKLISLLSAPKAITEQARVIVENFHQAFSPISKSSIVKNLPPGEAELLQNNFKAVARVYDENNKPLGLFALMDYTHFKGEGIGGGYNTQSWGLQRVLWNMQNVDPEFVHSHTALETFIASAKQVLEERIVNYRIERDRNNTPVANNKPNAHFDEDQYRNFWYDHLDAYLSWPQDFIQELD